MTPDRVLLPSRYGLDQLHLMMQSPHRLYAYWELTGACRRAHPGALELWLVPVETPARSVAVSTALQDVGSLWLDAEGACAYRVEIRDAGGAPLLTSAVVETPLARPPGCEATAALQLEGPVSSWIHGSPAGGGAGE